MHTAIQRRKPKTGHLKTPISHGMKKDAFACLIIDKLSHLYIFASSFVIPDVVSRLRSLWSCYCSRTRWSMYICIIVPGLVMFLRCATWLQTHSHSLWLDFMTLYCSCFIVRVLIRFWMIRKDRIKKSILLVERFTSGLMLTKLYSV